MAPGRLSVWLGPPFPSGRIEGALDPEASVNVAKYESFALILAHQFFDFDSTVAHG